MTRKAPLDADKWLLHPLHQTFATIERPNSKSEADLLLSNYVIVCMCPDNRNMKHYNVKKDSLTLKNLLLHVHTIWPMNFSVFDLRQSFTV